MPTARKILLLLALPALILLFFAIYAPADNGCVKIATLSEDETNSGGLHFSVDFPSDRPLNRLCVVSEAPQDTYPKPAITEGCAVEFFTKDGALYATLPDVPGYLYKAEELEIVYSRQPNGSVHPLRHILLSCEIKQPDGSRAVYLQQMELDIISHTADLVDCTEWPMALNATNLYVSHYHSLTPSGLPVKHSGSYIQRRMSELVYLTASIDSPERAQKYAPHLLSAVWDLAQEAPNAAQPWPECWGEYAADARTAAAMITPTLLYLQENKCFDCPKLAEYVNSAAFGMVFGNRFTVSPEERVQETPIPYIPVPARE